MLRLFLFILLSSALQVKASSMFVVVTDTIPVAQKVDYLAKARSQNAAGLTMIIVGGLAVVVGFVGVMGSGILDDSADSFAIIALVGAILCLGSIPFLRAAYMNKKKYKKSVSINLKMEKSNSLMVTGAGQDKFPAVKIGLRF